MNDTKRLRSSNEKQRRRLEKLKREQPTIMSQTVFIGTLGLMMVLPIIAGAYLGQWLDGLSEDQYTVRWTLGMILLGVVVGAVNVYLFIRDH